MFTRIKSCQTAGDHLASVLQEIENSKLTEKKEQQILMNLRAADAELLAIDEFTSSAQARILYNFRQEYIEQERIGFGDDPRSLEALEKPQIEVIEPNQ